MPETEGRHCIPLQAELGPAGLDEAKSHEVLPLLAPAGR